MTNTVTEQAIAAKIRKTTYTVLPNGRTTICQITLENGFSVEGKSACVDIANFDEVKGQQYAFRDAFRQIWELEGYLLAEAMYRDEAPDFLAGKTPANLSGDKTCEACQ